MGERPLKPRHPASRRLRPGRRWLRALAAVCAAALLSGPAWAQTAAPDLAKPGGAIRIATFNVNMARSEAGKLIRELRGEGGAAASAQIAAVVEIIQRVRPDVLFVNELDHDPAHEALLQFERALKIGRGGAEPIAFAHRFTAPVNTGVLSGVDIDLDGAIGLPDDGFGWGLFEGQFGMAVLSNLPIAERDVRSFRLTPWARAGTVTHPDGRPYFAPEAADALRLSSKSHWDVPGHAARRSADPSARQSSGPAGLRRSGGPQRRPQCG